MILGLVLGVAVGLFFGEPAGVLSIAGDAYIRLLQMTVLPYVIVSLVAGLGGLDASMARRIGLRGGSQILLIWGATLATLLCLPLAYPAWTSAAFFSTNLVEQSAPFDFLGLYLPANPFASMSLGVVPAVVAFSIALGLALIGVNEKEGLIQALKNISDALMKIASFVGKIAPIGIFAISAAAAGTLELEELSRLQVFLWVYLGAWSVLCFLTLPGFVAWATPFTYREVLRESRTPMVTAFATGTVLVVLPMIAECCKRLVKERGLDSPEAETTLDVLVPTAYSFPSAGTLLGLGFVLFAAWYVGTPLSEAQYPAFVTVGALVAFGSMAVAIPFMLDFFSLSADLFQLYLLGSVVTARFATALAALHGVVVCLLGVTAVMGRLNLRALARTFALSVVVSAALMAALGFVLTRAIPYAYGGEDIFVSMSLLTEPVKTASVELPESLSRADLLLPRLDVVRERGTLRVGYLPDRLPFAHRSAKGDVVGFDIDLVHMLARDLEVELELLRLSWPEGVDALNEGSLDLLVGGIGMTPARATRTAFSRSYIAQSLAFVIRDHERDKWVDLATVRERPGIRIGMVTTKDSGTQLQKLLPDADLVEQASARPFLRGDVESLDALAIGAEAGSAWTLIYPDFTVVVPKGLHVKDATGFALPIREDKMHRYMDTWLELAETNGHLEDLYEYWILGHDESRRVPRWSIIKDVLGWTGQIERETR